MKIYDYNGKSNISGERIRRRRLELGLSQSELAARLQLQNVMLDQKAVSRAEPSRGSVLWRILSCLPFHGP